MLNLLGKLLGWDKVTEDYWLRFIVPQIARAKAAGITQARTGELLQEALDMADFQTAFPAEIFRDLVDTEIEELAARKVAQNSIVERFEAIFDREKNNALSQLRH